MFVDIVFLSAADDIFSLSLSLSDEIGKCLLRRRRFDTKVRFAFHERKEGKSVFREKTNREEFFFCYDFVFVFFCYKKSFEEYNRSSGKRKNVIIGKGPSFVMKRRENFLQILHVFTRVRRIQL